MTTSLSLFACKNVSFEEPFIGGQEIKIFISKRHATKSSFRGNGAAIWVESVNNKAFTVKGSLLKRFDLSCFSFFLISFRLPPTKKKNPRPFALHSLFHVPIHSVNRERLFLIAVNLERND